MVIGERAARARICRTLDAWMRGVVAIEASGVESSVALAREARAALAIVDVPTVMPRDLEVITALHAALPELPIIAVGSLPETPYAARALRAGAISYVWELDLPDGLVQVVEAALEAFDMDDMA